MKFLAALLLTFATNANADRVVVVKNFLSKHECDDILSQLASEPIKEEQTSDASRRRSHVKVRHDTKLRIATTFANAMSSTCGGAEDSQACDVDSEAASSLKPYLNSTFLTATNEPEPMLLVVTKTTDPHTDYWFNPTTNVSEPVMNKVGFAFLNDQQEAHFSIGEQQVVPQMGSLVIFDGNVPHHTVLSPSSVGESLHLLGPFQLVKDYGLMLVGQCGSEGNPCLPTPQPKKSKKKKTKNDKRL